MSSAHEIQSDVDCHREENEDVKRACWLPFLFQALAPPQSFREGVCADPTSVRMARNPTLKAAVNLSRLGVQGFGGQLEVSMCVDTTAVGGDGGYQENNKY